MREVARPHRRIIFEVEAERLRAELPQIEKRTRAEVLYVMVRPQWTAVYEAYRVARERWWAAGARLPDRQFTSPIWTAILVVVFAAEGYLFSAAFSGAGETDWAGWVMGTAVAAGFTAGPYALARIFRHAAEHGIVTWFVAAAFIATGGWLVAQLGPLRLEVIARTLASVGVSGTVLGAPAVWALTSFSAAFSLLLGYFRLDADAAVERCHEELRAREKQFSKASRRLRPVAVYLLIRRRRTVLADRLVQLEGVCAIDDFGVAYVRNGGPALPDHDLGRHLFDPDLLDLGDPIANDIHAIMAVMARVETEVAERMAKSSKREGRDQGKPSFELQSKKEDA